MPIQDGPVAAGCVAYTASSVAVSPPLTIAADEIALIASALSDALDAVQAKAAA